MSALCYRRNLILYLISSKLQFPLRMEAEAGAMVSKPAAGRKVQAISEPFT